VLKGQKYIRTGPKAEDENKMKIKQLHIRGFKSFLGPIKLDLSSDIVAIVGPNGSGKSNVIDAIRWCLGEQNSRILRGMKMEDVIFNGAGDVKPLGMAEVRILLENSMHENLPEHLSRPEIEVARRLYRNGESEYLINNTPCRLKDIQDLLMGTGLGQRSYSIIGQGAIGSILDYRPDQFRELLHEAADITRYHRQVEMSQKRILAAQENLVRIRDVLIELEKQVNSLKRQAEKAKKFKKITEELQNLELTLLANEYNELNKNLLETSKISNSLLGEEISIRTLISQKESRLQDLETTMEELEFALKGLYKTYGNYKTELNNKKALIQGKERELKLLEDKKSEILSELQLIDQKLMAISREIGQINRDLNELNSEISTYLEKRSNIEKDLQTIDNKRKEVKNKYDSTVDQFHKLESERNSVQKDINYIMKILSDIDNKKRELNDQINGINNLIEKLKSRWKDLSANKNLYESELSSLETNIKALIAQRDEIIASEKGLEEKKRSVEAQITETKLRIKTGEELLQSRIKRGARHIIQGKERLKDHGLEVIGILGELIEVEEGFEQWLEAALGEKLDYLVVKDVKDSIRFIEYLKREGKGKSGFISCKNGKNPNFSSKLPFLIKTPDYLKDILTELLKDVTVVDTLQTALEEHSKNGSSKIYITREGDIFYRGVFIYGGGEDQSQESILSRRAKLRQMKLKLNELEAQLTSTNNEIKLLKDKEDELEAELKRYYKEKAFLQENLKKIEYELYKVGADIESQQKMKDMTIKQLDRNTDNINYSKEQLEDLKTRLKALQEVENQKRQFLDELKTLVTQHDNLYEATKKDYYKVDTSIKLMEEKRLSFSKQKEKMEGGIKELRQKKEKLRQSSAETESRIEKCKSEIKDANDSLEDIEMNLNDYRFQINKKEQDIEKVKEEITKLRGEIGHLQQKLNEIKDEVTRVKMSESELKTEIKNLVNTCFELHNAELTKVYKDYLLENYSKAVLESDINAKREQKAKLGDVNLLAISEYEETKKRVEFLKSQETDIVRSIENIEHAIMKFKMLSKEALLRIHSEINSHLFYIFQSLFGGGAARLRFLDEENPLESGVILEAEFPNKKLTHLGLLSGGEKALVALALLFSIFKTRPSPFCLLDEVDSALDDINVERLCRYLQELKTQTQIIIVTHKPRTMEIADLLYGVTMERKGISTVLVADLASLRATREN